MEAIRRFLKDESGQDLIEYSLLIGFIALASAALFARAGSSVNDVWGAANTTLHNAELVAAS